MTASDRFPCPQCGYQRTASRCWECDIDESGDRSALAEVFFSGVTTAFLLPFLQGVATGAGEQAVLKLQSLLRRRTAAGTEPAHAGISDIVVTDRRLIIRMPAEISAGGAQSLIEILSSPVRSGGWEEVIYDTRTGSWRTEPTDPPSDTGPALPPAE